MALAETTRAGVEAELREAIRTGQLVDLRTGDPVADDPAHGAGWDAQRTVAAVLLAELLTSAEGPRRPRALRLAGARVVGQLDLEATALVCPLLLHGCWFAEPVNLAEARAPAIRLPGCHLPGLSADQLTTSGNLELDEGFTATGEVGLLGAHIGGQLILSGAGLSNPGGPALAADQLTVGQDLFCRNGFSARGEVRLLGAHIGGQLSLRGASLSNPDGLALNADQLTVDQGVHCSEGFKADGEVRLPGAHIRGQLAFHGATLHNPDGFALVADKLTVDHDVFFQEGFSATGEVRLVGAHIGGQLNFRGATLTNLDGRALNAQELRAGPLILSDLTKPPERVDLTHAKVGTLGDAPASWPTQSILDGFVYDALYENRLVSARERLGWLARNPQGYTPQPYEQLAAVYRRAGRDHDARTVAIAKQWRRRRMLTPLGKLWNLMLYATVGYGYRMWLTIAWLLVLVGLGWWAFDRAYPAHLVAAKPPGQRPPFHAALYALDLLLPFADSATRAPGSGPGRPGGCSWGGTWPVGCSRPPWWLR
jgi:hypothetical protein